MPQFVYPPEAERYVIAAQFACRVLRNEATPEEVEYMNRFLALDVDAETLFPGPAEYEDALGAVLGLTDERKTV